ncbi:MAG: VWA domain-containing protein [Pseudomonadota bacterium]
MPTKFGGSQVLVTFKSVIRTLIFSALTFLMFIHSGLANDRAIIVFDGSGSMWGQINGVNKIVSARQTLADVLPKLPRQLDLGLIAYGHNRKGDCSDIEMLVSPGPIAQTERSISQAVNGLSPKGKTPLSDAVRKAAEELRFTEEKATVVLITDGLETCEADPCALGTELNRLGLEFKTHVIGFGLNAEEGKRVACLAENTGGQYFQADDADALGDALTKTVKAEVEVPPQPTPVVQQNRPTFNLIATPVLGDESSDLFTSKRFAYLWKLESEDPNVDQSAIPQIGRLPSARYSAQPGRYRVTATYGAISGSVEVDLGEFETTEVTIPMEAGMLDVDAFSVNDSIGLQDENYKWEVRNLETNTSFNGFTNKINEIVSAGRYEVKFFPGKLGKVALEPIFVEVKAGETTEATAIAPVTRVQLKGYDEDGRELGRKEVIFKLFDGPTNRENYIWDFWGPSNVYLMPGKYTALIEYRLRGERVNVEETFEVGAAEDRVIEFRFSGQN